MKFFSGQKGVQSVITAFLLVVVFVTVLLLLIYFNYEGVAKKQALSQSYHFFQQNAFYKDQIENCLKIPEKQDLSNIVPDLNKCIPAGVKGYFIERMDSYKCTYARLETGDINGCEHILIYYLNLRESDTMKCLARLTVCIGEGRPPAQFTSSPPPLTTPSGTPPITPFWNVVVIPTQPEFQKDPLKCHGLAYYLAKLNEKGEMLDVYRIAGPNDAFPGHNSGPYVVKSPILSDLESYIRNLIQTDPVFKKFEKVEFYTLQQQVNVDLKLIAVMRPLKTCILIGDFDTPSTIFTAMGIPHYATKIPADFMSYIPAVNDCIAENGLIIYGCHTVPESKIAKLVKDGVTLVHTDGYNRDVFPFPQQVKGDSTTCQATNAEVWEGDSKGSFDLNIELKKFFQTPYEKMNWGYSTGHKVISFLSPEVKTLASGNYCIASYPKWGQSIPQAVMLEMGKGRYFYFSFHIEGGGSTQEKLFMSSLYSGALSSKLNVLPTNCISTGIAGQKSRACPHAQQAGHSFIVWPSLETIVNVRVTVQVDGQPVSWITPSNNNFNLTAWQYLDLEMDVPAGIAKGNHSLEVIFEADNSTPVTVKGSLSIT